MKIAALCFCLMPWTLRAAWVLNSTLPTPTNITPDIKTESISAYLHAFYVLSNGTPHMLLGFDGSSGQAWDIDLSNSVSQVVTLTNEEVMGACIPTFSNTVVLVGKSGPSHSYELDPIAKTFSLICTNTDTFALSLSRAPDGAIFFGSYGVGRVDEWNPSNRVFRTWGQVDDALDPEVEAGNYVYLCTGLDYIYAVLRNGADWYLSVIDRATSNKTLYWKGEAENLDIFDTLDGKVALYVRTNGGGISYWMLTNGVPSSIGSLPSHYDSTYEKPGIGTTEPGVNNDFNNLNTETGWEFDIDATAYSVSGSASSASMRWKKTNDVTWLSITETNGWLPETATIIILQTWTGDKLLWISDGYGPVGEFTPGGAASVLGAYKNQSSRDVLQVSASEVYVSGYHLNSFRWNPSSAWTRTPSVQDFTSQSYNPYTFDTTGGKYHSFMVLGSDGRLFTASRYDRTEVGGGLAWYNRNTGALGLERNTFTNSWETPSDLKPAESASKLVWCSWGGSNYVFDVATFTLLTNFSLTGTSPMHKVVEYENGKMFGVSGSNTFGFTTAGALLWSNNLPASPLSATSSTTDYTRLTKGPDGCVWIPSTTYLYRVNPSDGSYSNVVSITSGPNKILFDGGTAYLYGGTAIYKLGDLLLNQEMAKVSKGKIGKGQLK